MNLYRIKPFVLAALFVISTLSASVGISIAAIAAPMTESAPKIQQAAYVADCVSGWFDGSNGNMSSGTLLNSGFSNFTAVGGVTMPGSDSSGNRKCSEVSATIKALGFKDDSDFLLSLGCPLEDGLYLCRRDHGDRNRTTVFNEILSKKSIDKLTDAIKYHIALSTFSKSCGSRVASPSQDQISVADSSTSWEQGYVRVKEAGSTGNGVVYKLYDGVKKGTEVNTINRASGWDPDGKFRCESLAGMTGSYAQAYTTWANANKEDAETDANNGGTSGGSSTAEESEVTCSIAGVGWILCPAFRALAALADGMYSFFTQFLNTPTAVYAPGSPLEDAWAKFRTLANTAFVILFMVVIYAQLTGGLLSAYTIKRMFARIVMTAILVNLSFIICALAVDASNIIGSNLKDFIAGQASVDVQTMDSAPAEGQPGMWAQIAANVLAIGAVAGGVGAAAGAVATIGFLPALVLVLIMIIPVIVALVMILFILLIRQAAIILLIAISPLAFVAYLLPNTEKWFGRWRSLFTSLLLVYPIIGGIYGGALLASSILQNAYGANATGASGMMGQILAAAVVVLPLFFVPSVLKGSIKGMGSIGAKISGAGDKLSGKMTGGLKNSGMMKNAEKVRADKRARIASGAYVGKGRLGKFSLAHMRSENNRKANQSRLFNRVTAGYGAERDLHRQAQERSDMKEAVDMFGGNDRLARAWALSGGNLAKARGLQDADGKLLDPSGEEQFKRLQAAGHDNKASSHLAAVKMLSEGGKGDAEEITKALETARDMGADAATVGSAKASAEAAYRNAGRGDAVAGLAGKSTSEGWSGVAAQSVHREGLKSDAQKEAYHEYLKDGVKGGKSGRTATIDALRGYDKMEARAQNAAHEQILKAAEHHTGQQFGGDIEKAKAAMGLYGDQGGAVPTASVSPATVPDSAPIQQAAASTQTQAPETVQRINHAQDSQPVVSTPPAPSSRPTPPQPPTPPPSR